VYGAWLILSIVCLCDQQAYNHIWSCIPNEIWIVLIWIFWEPRVAHLGGITHTLMKDSMIWMLHSGMNTCIQPYPQASLPRAPCSIAHLGGITHTLMKDSMIWMLHSSMNTCIQPYPEHLYLEPPAQGWPVAAIPWHTLAPFHFLELINSLITMYKHNRCW
jgi:hypothetical protein